MHGVGQGNGAGPAIWAAVSTPILNYVRSKGFGCKIIAPISSLRTKYVGYAFVDDTDLIQISPFSIDAQEAVTGLQGSIDAWDAGLKLTGGAWYQKKLSGI
jgi:hypothetical protein